MAADVRLSDLKSYHSTSQVIETPEPGDLLGMLLLVAGAAGLALLRRGGTALAALVRVVEAGALEDDPRGVEDALGLVPQLGQLTLGWALIGCSTSNVIPQSGQ